MIAENPPLTIWGRLRSSAAASLVKRGIWGLADQALISLANFLTIVVIARTLDPDRFGEFALALSFINVTMALASAALTQPFVVLSARYGGKQGCRFLSSTLLAQSLFLAAIAVPIAMMALITEVMGWRFASLVALVIPAIAAWQIQEFLRQVFYAESRLQAAFLNDVISYGGQMAGFIVATFAGFLTPVSGLAILALTSMMAIAHALWFLRKSLEWSFSRNEFARFMSEIWSFGRWTLGSSLIQSVTATSFSFMLAGFSGPAAVGVMRAFVTITAPIRIVVTAAATSFAPSAARINERQGLAGLRPYIRRIFLLVGPPIAAYCLLASTFAGPVLNLLYGGRFDNYDWLLPLYVGSFFITEIFFAVDIGLRARRITDVHFKASMWGALASWLLGPPLVYFLGLTGVLAFHLALAPLAGIMMWLRYQREVAKQDRDGTPVIAARATS
jgi:O-antigen/teichoic acid export membrane protein